MTAQQEFESVLEPQPSTYPVLRWKFFESVTFFNAIRETSPVADIKPSNYCAACRYEEAAKGLTDFARFGATGCVGWRNICKRREALEKGLASSLLRCAPSVPRLAAQSSMTIGPDVIHRFAVTAAQPTAKVERTGETRCHASGRWELFGSR